MVLGRKTGICTICKKKGRTEWHHIISQHHAKKTGQKNLISNPDNVVELCRSCHNQTTASMVRKRLMREERGISIQRRRDLNEQKRKETKAREKAKEERNLAKKRAKLAKEEKRNAERKARNEKIRLSKKQRHEEILLRKKQFQEKKIESINRLKKRGVFIENPPSHRKRDFVRYLKQNLENDESVKNWFDFFHTNYRRINLCKLYPVDHWLYDPNKFDKKLSLNYERDGFMWTETGFTWHKPVEKKSSEDEIYQEIIDVINLVTTEFTKAKKDIKKEISGVLNYLLVGK